MTGRPISIKRKVSEMKLFGRKSGSASARPALLRAPWGALTVGEWPRGYEAQVREGYVGNPVAQRAMRLVSESAGAAPLAGGTRELALCNTASAGQSLIETAAAHLLLHGNAFIQILCDAQGAPAELFALRPERVTIEPDAQGWPAAYLYRVGEKVMRLEAKDGLGHPSIVHIRAMHPLDDHYGLGALGAAAGAVAIHNAATRWNKALLDNAARPSGALVYDPGDPGAALSGEQFERLKEEMEAGFAGAANAGRPMLLEGGLKWQAMSLTPADMDFVGLKAAAAREIALAFGVPPMLLGLPGDNTYANYREANRALWRLGVLPLTGKILGGIAQGVGAWWPDTALSIDLDKVPALSEDREKLWAQVSAADFLSPEEKRAMLGIE
jgi:HK97 family phage portal protein